MSGNDFFDTEYRYRNSTGAQQAPISQYRLSHNGVYQCRAKHSFLLFMGDSRNGDRNDYFYYSGQRLHHEYLLSEVNIVNDLMNTNKSKAIELIDNMQHFSKDKFNLSDDKKLIIFNDDISYKEY